MDPAVRVFPLTSCHPVFNCVGPNGSQKAYLGVCYLCTQAHKSSSCFSKTQWRYICYMASINLSSVEIMQFWMKPQSQID